MTPKAAASTSHRSPVEMAAELPAELSTRTPNKTPTTSTLPLTPSSDPSSSPSLSIVSGLIPTIESSDSSQTAAHTSGSFQFGEDKEISPFTFRKLYNATPEPENQTSTASLQAKFGALSIPSRGSGSHGRSLSVSALEVSDRQAAQLEVVVHQPKQGKYDTKDEKPPNEPYFEPGFQEALKHGTQLAGKIDRILHECELANDPDSQVYNMAKMAEDLRHFEAPAVCTIAVVGDSGVGKSSLINSLLGEAKLARTSGLGAACTSIVTEYRLKTHEQPTKYTIEVDLMTDQEIAEQLHELLWSYRQFYLCDLNDTTASIDEQEPYEDTV